MALYTVESLSLSKIGDLLREQLGEEATSYTFPEDFEKAVVDIGFKGLVLNGDSAPYDLVVIGDAIMARTTSMGMFLTLKTVRMIGTQNIGAGAFYSSSIQKVIFPTNNIHINDDAFRQMSSDFEMENTEYVKSCGNNLFRQSNSLKNVTFENMTTIGSYMFYQCSGLENVSLPSVTITNSFWNQMFYQDTSLKTVTLGKVGNTISGITNNTFGGCTQTGLTITIYTNATYVDTLRTNIRNGATKATIIIKASEETTYNGTTYNAGDTILTSTP